MKKGSKLKCAFYANALVVFLELIALVISLMDQGVDSFQFYTQDSNYFAMAVCLLFCVYSVRELSGNGEIPFWIHTLRYISVSCLMVTLFVVLFVLMPLMEENALQMLYGSSMLYQHTLCPIIAALSFFVWEARDCLPRNVIPKALVPTALYACVTVTLNLLYVMEGPYPFLMVYAQPWYASVLWGVLVLGIAVLLALAVWGLSNLIWKKSSRNRAQPYALMENLGRK